MRGQSANGLDEAVLARFLNAPSREAAEEAARAMAGSTVPFDAVLSGLRSGRTYQKSPAGTDLGSRADSTQVVHPYFFVIPANYDPAKKYPVRFYLHGGVGRPAWPDNQPAWFPNYTPLVPDDAIVVFPAAWNQSRWWEPRQVENLADILDRLKRTYNVDENRASLLGISDGATGIFYHAMLASTPWSAMLPFNGQPAVLANVASPNGAALFAGNAASTPFYIVHGALDRLYPLASVTPWWTLFEAAGLRPVKHVKDQHGHDIRWWPEEAPLLDAFIQAHPRDPLPDRVDWETGQTDRFNRSRWVVIDEIGAAVDESVLESVNQVTPRLLALGVGIRVWTDAAGGGVNIVSIQPGSLADSNGIWEGDVVRGLGAESVTGVEQLQNALEANAGTSINLVLERAGQTVPLTLRLPPASTPSPRTAFARRAPSGRVQVERTGNSVAVRTGGVRNTHCCSRLTDSISLCPLES